MRDFSLTAHLQLLNKTKEMDTTEGTSTTPIYYLPIVQISLLTLLENITNKSILPYYHILNLNDCCSLERKE